MLHRAFPCDVDSYLDRETLYFIGITRVIDVRRSSDQNFVLHAHALRQNRSGITRWSPQ